MNLINDEIPKKDSNISADVRKLKNSTEVKKLSDDSKVISEQIKVKKAIQILKRSKTKSTQSVNLINTVTKGNDNLQMSEFKAKYINKIGLSEKDSTHKNNYLETKNKTSIEEKENGIKNGTIVAKQSKCEEINDALKNINQTTKNVIDIDEEAAEFEDVEIPEEVDEIIVPDEAAAEDLTNDEETEINISSHEESTNSVVGEKDENEILVNEDEGDKKSINEEQRDESSKGSGEGDIDNLTVEPELITIEDGIKGTLNCPLDNNANDQEHLNEDSSKNLIHDPLNCADNQDEDDEKTINNKKTEHSWKNKSSDNNDKDGDDDEVQFIETRNSPIYIESDEDESDSKLTRANSNSTENQNNGKQTITTESTTVTLSKNITVTRTSARKSTAKSQQQQQQQQNHAVITKSLAATVPHILVRSKSKNFSYLQKATNNKQSSSIISTQKIIDCIELLDSSDEECTSSQSRSSQQQHVKTPQKRTLLAAKGNYYKNYNKTTTSNNNCITNNFSPNLRQQAKKPLPPPLPPPTPQSNFLNAVQLQPAAVSGVNPPAFSALLSNKNVIIPNAFYGNPPSVRDTSDTELDRRYASWLENFLNQFCKPQFVPTHSCYVFLQRALKYKDFVRIKTLRSSMNIHDQKDQINNQLMMALRTILLKNTKRITNYGRRFCELTCSSVHGKALTLMAHSITGKVTLKTCNMEMPRTSTILSSGSSSNTSTNTLTRKRQLDEDEEEYTPDKSKLKHKPKSPLENLDRDNRETGEDRKRSLRTKRTKRLDNSFSYNEDDLLAEYEIEDEEEAEKLAQAEIQRKIDQKRLEAQKQRQQQVKSFESAFIQAFAKSIDGPTSSVTATNPSNHRIRLKNIVATSTNIRQYTANNDAEDLLQATWIENLENDDTQIISDDDEPKEHRIYKQQQKEQLQIPSHPPQNNHTTTNTSIRFINANPPSPKFKQLPKHQEEIITGDDDCNKNNYTVPLYWPKNIDPQMYINGKFKDRCIICNLSCQRLVHHYVNEHRGCEVYNSRLSLPQIKLLKKGNYSVSSVSLYKNGQFQYEAYCIFCQKQSRFMLPYWYQHFTMHTGEYAYRCTGCGVRKPTRSLMTQHQTQGCPADGGVAQDYLHDSKSSQIEAKICTLCNYVQLHRNNIVKHLHQQHNIKQILPKHIQTIVLLKTSTTTATTTGSMTSITSSSANTNRCYDNHVSSSSSIAHKTYVIDDDDTDNENNVILDDVSTEDSPPPNIENHYYNYIPPYMQAAVNSGNFSFESVDASDDLSFMICGMLDVQMNPESN